MSDKIIIVGSEPFYLTSLARELAKIPVVEAQGIKPFYEKRGKGKAKNRKDRWN